MCIVIVVVAAAPAAIYCMAIVSLPLIDLSLFLSFHAINERCWLNRHPARSNGKKAKLRMSSPNG